MAGPRPFWTKERLGELWRTLDEMSKEVEGTDKKAIDLKSNLAYTVWEIYAKTHPDVPLSSVSPALILFVEMGVLDKAEQRGVRIFNPKVELSDENVKKARARQRARRSSGVARDKEKS